MADNDTLRLGRRRRGSNQVSLALPVDNDEEDEMAASFVMGNSGVEFHRADVRIDKDGLYINGAATGPIQEEGVGNAASIHQNDLYPICELGRGACGIVRKVSWCRPSACLHAALLLKLPTVVLYSELPATPS
jgi:hypothetical protein